MFKREAIKGAMVRCSDPLTGKVMFEGFGYDHNSCYEYLAEAFSIYARVNREGYIVEEGFETTSGNFVDRKKAYLIAYGNNQLSTTNRDGILQSWMINQYFYKI